MPSAEYARLEERILARDQIGASRVLYGLLKQGRPATERVGLPLMSMVRPSEALGLDGR